jgi:hypothetical protein
MTSVMVQAFNIIQDRISRARLAGDPPDLSLHPNCPTSACRSSTAPAKPLIAAIRKPPPNSAKSPACRLHSGWPDRSQQPTKAPPSFKHKLRHLSGRLPLQDRMVSRRTAPDDQLAI